MDNIIHATEQCKVVIHSKIVKLNVLEIIKCVISWLLKFS